MILFHVLQMLL